MLADYGAADSDGFDKFGDIVFVFHEESEQVEPGWFGEQFEGV